MVGNEEKSKGKELRMNFIKHNVYMYKSFKQSPPKKTIVYTSNTSMLLLFN